MEIRFDQLDVDEIKKFSRNSGSVDGVWFFGNETAMLFVDPVRHGGQKGAERLLQDIHKIQTAHGHPSLTQSVKLVYPKNNPSLIAEQLVNMASSLYRFIPNPETHFTTDDTIFRHVHQTAHKLEVYPQVIDEMDRLLSDRLAGPEIAVYLRKNGCPVKGPGEGFDLDADGIVSRLKKIDETMIDYQQRAEDWGKALLPVCREINAAEGLHSHHSTGFCDTVYALTRVLDREGENGLSKEENDELKKSVSFFAQEAVANPDLLKRSMTPMHFENKAVWKEAIGKTYADAVQASASTQPLSAPLVDKSSIGAMKDQMSRSGGSSDSHSESVFGHEKKRHNYDKK